MNLGRKSRLLSSIAAVVIVLAGLAFVLWWFWSSVPFNAPQPDAQVGAYAPQAWMVVAVILTSLTALLAVATSFYLYRWRRFLSTKPHLLMPEEHGRYIQKLDNHVRQLRQEWQQVVPALARRIDAVKEQSAELRSSFLTLQQSLDEKDREIARLKAGYDRHVFKSYLNRFLRVDRALADFIEEGVGNQGLEHSRRLLEDALEECGVSLFEPAIGEAYAETDGVADQPKLVEVTDPSKHGRILSVLEPGYRVETPDGAEIIQAAKVEVGAYEPQKTEEEL